MKSKISEVKVMKFSESEFRGGIATSIDSNGKDVPFNIRRIFYIYGSDERVVRGQHANKKSEFVLINVCGTSKVRVDDGENVKVFELDKPNIGLYLPTMIWKEMYEFSQDAVLLVLASEHYDAEEYIRSYDAFTEMVKKGKEET